MSPDSPTGAAENEQVLDSLDRSGEQSPQDVVDVAVRLFAQRPFSDTKLSDIAREAGMSKRMIHYHFGDKRGLYQAALAEAVRRLQPEPEAMVVDSSIPVEGVRRVIDALNDCYLAHPESVALLRTENLQKVLPLAEMPPLVDHTPVILNLDRLLLLGQDAGAFRPGISAYDVYFLVIALLSRGIVDQPVPQNLYGTDMSSPANVEGTHRMTVDAVLAFLTANISDAGRDSYLNSEQGGPRHKTEAAAPAVYGEEDASSAIYGSI